MVTVRLLPSGLNIVYFNLCLVGLNLGHYDAVRAAFKLSFESNFAFAFVLFYYAF